MMLADQDDPGGAVAAALAKQQEYRQQLDQARSAWQALAQAEKERLKAVRCATRAITRAEPGMKARGPGRAGAWGSGAQRCASAPR